MTIRWSLLLVFVGYLLLPCRAFPTEDSKINIHGYISQGFLASNKNNYLGNTEKGSFQFNELGINFSTEITEKLRIGFQAAARDLGDLGNYRPTINWAYADYQLKDWLGFRAGLIKLPLGLYNKTRDMDMLRTSILLPQGIYNENYRDTATAIKGISLYGNVSLKRLGDMSYQVLFGTMNVLTGSGTTKAVAAGSGAKVEEYDVGRVYCGAIIWETPLAGLQVGISHEKIPLTVYSILQQDIVVPISYPPFTRTIATKGAPMVIELPSFLQTVGSLEYIGRNFILAAEYCRIKQRMEIHFPGEAPIPRDRDVEAYYGSASYRFYDWFEAGLCYSVLNQYLIDSQAGTRPFVLPYHRYQKDAYLSLRFDLNSHWIFKVEGHLMNGSGGCFAADNLNDDGVP
ncbi:MAG: hypothetical protein GY765_43520, partial [bacterium]|nr:hypothetical protein [bacterium]